MLTEIAHQKSRTRQSSYPRHNRRQQGNVHLGRVNGGMAHFKSFAHCCGNNDRLSHKERKTRRCIMVQSAQQPPQMVAPERDRPGKKAKHWKKPINSASRDVRLARYRTSLRTTRFRSFSTTSSSTPLRNRNNAAEEAEPNTLRNQCSNRPPTITAGTVARQISHRICRLSSWIRCPNAPNAPLPKASQSCQKKSAGRRMSPYAA